MKWQPSPGELVNAFDKTIESIPGAEKRKMFGYPASFVNGHMFAGLYRDSYVLRLSPTDCAAFLKLEGSKPFEPMPGHTMASYVVVPQSMLGAPDEIALWLRKALDYAKALPPKHRKAKKAKSS